MTKAYSHIISGENFSLVPEERTLKASRGVSFEDVVLAIESGGLLDVVEHSNSARYPNQGVFVVAITSYVYLVPHVDEAEYVFLKTIIPSRKAMREYGMKEKP
jgi:hypothetical protein